MQIAQSKQACGWESNISKLFEKDEAVKEIESQAYLMRIELQKCMAQEGIYIKTILSPNQNINGRITDFVQYGNLFLPMEMKKFISIDELDSGYNKIIIRYTILDQKIADAALDTLSVPLKPLLRSFCSALDSNQLIDTRISMVSEFRNPQGKTLISASIPVKECLNPPR
ncbi:hypothetical protein [Vibrio mangrovi]|uniref:Uncharacterized protein n=1 Tax=Vibrio mangrovi TaxID=474394 RepID=A0ABU4I5Y3_9VIBR|nr:hypothetical protein [Vibrio mangrovi]MDW6003254.1 hypothetical protein [Vibrio mangrovi]